MSETETVPNVQQAWAAVMADVQGLGKHQRTDSGSRFSFRGVDDVMNAVGPVLRKHGVAVVPTSVQHVPESYATKSGTAMRNATVLVSYAIHGPAGDSMAGAAAGEAADAGDKATPKAMSVAFRTFLLQALCLPTDERDPDMEQHERAAEQQPPTETPEQTALRGIAQAQDAATLDQVVAWADGQGLASNPNVVRAVAGKREMFGQLAGAGA